MNWGDGSGIGVDEFLAEWQRASDDRSHRPVVGDSSIDAAARFIEGLVDLESTETNVAVVVTHGGVTVDALRTIAGDASVCAANAGLIADGVPGCAITQLRVSKGAVTVIEYPSTDHLDRATRHRPE